MPWPDLSRRCRSQEWMDSPGVDTRDLHRSLKFIRLINAALGYRRQTIRHLANFSRTWKPAQTITILDVATGSADMPLAIAQWARQRGLDLRVVGLDLHPQTLAAAREIAPQIALIRADALRLPFADASFDYAITSMFLHHLDDSIAIAVLSEMDRVSRRGIIAADLLRTRRAYAWIWALTLVTSPMIRHDARASVAQAFSLEEAESLRSRARLGFARVVHHHAHRFAIAGEKPAH